MNNPPVPTLSAYGWVTNLAEKIDFLLAHGVHSDAEQDSVYQGSVFSVQAIVQRHSDDPTAMASELVSALKAYLVPYYPEGVDITTKATPAQDQEVVNENRLNIAISIKFKVNGIEYSAPHLLKLIDSKFVQFARDNNGDDQ